MKLKTVDDLKALLMQLPKLVDLFEGQSVYFTRDLKIWLKKVEECFGSNRRSEVGKIAGLRGEVISAELGVWRDNAYCLEENLSGKRRGTKKKIVRAIGGQVLKQSEEIISRVIEPLETAVDEAKNTMNQLLLLAVQNGVVDNKLLNDGNSLREIWTLMVQDSQLRPGTQKILSLVTIPEVLCLISDILEDWKRQAKAEEYQHSNPPNLRVLSVREKPSS